MKCCVGDKGVLAEALHEQAAQQFDCFYDEVAMLSEVKRESYLM